MKSRSLEPGLLLVAMLLTLMLGGCNGRVDAAAETLIGPKRTQIGFRGSL